ncbi:MAG: proprotein convertase P-domain-containing protein [Bacteroidota bacterium]
MKKIYILFILASSALLYTQQLNAQCGCTNCPQPLPDNTLDDFFVNVMSDGTADCDLATNPLQSVAVNFDHEYVGDLTITLTSPDGQTITLIGPTGFFGATDDTVWDITFVDGTASPDPGFSAMWNNNQVWGTNNNYTGSYNPFSGNLSDFTGNLCGTWVLNVTDDQGLDIGNFLDFDLVFASPNGLNCNSEAPPATCATAVFPTGYDNGSVDVVLIEVCPDNPATEGVTMNATTLNTEGGFDFLTIYSGAADSGTSGTAIYGPVSGTQDGLIISSNVGECLTMVINADGIVDENPDDSWTGSFSCYDPCASTCAEAATEACNFYETPVNDIADSFAEVEANGGRNNFPSIGLPTDGTPIRVTTCVQYTHTATNSCQFGVGSGRAVFEYNDTNSVTDCDGNPIQVEVYDASCNLLETIPMTADIPTANVFSPAMMGTTYTVCVTNEVFSETTDGECALQGTLLDITPIQCASTEASLAASSLCEDDPFTINLNNCFVPTNVDIPGGLTSGFIVVYDTDNTNTPPTDQEIYDDLTGTSPIAELINFSEIATSCAGTELAGLLNFNNDGCSEFETDIYLVPIRSDNTLDFNCKIGDAITLTTFPNPDDFTVDIVAPDCIGTAPTATLVAPDGTTVDCTAVVTGTAGQDGNAGDCNGSLTYDFTSFFDGFPCPPNTTLTGDLSSTCACQQVCEASTTMEFNN